MKKRILLFTAVVGFVSLGISSYNDGPANHGYDCTGAETAGTGAFANSNGCTFTGGGCHSTSATTGIVVSIELDSAGVPTTHYVGGGTYTVKITGDGTATANSHYGFQLAALKDTVSRVTETNAGTWASTGLPAGTQRIPNGTNTQLTCLEQSSTQTGSSFSKTFSWTAPAAGTGTISFWGVANFVDNDGHENAADVWNTTHVNIHEWPTTTAVASAGVNVGLTAFPNPVTNNLTVQMNNTLPGKYTLQVFDMSGRSVLAQTIEVNGINSSATITTSDWAVGTYHVVVTNGNERHDTQVVKL